VRVTGYKDQHVWHCSLSLSPDEGPLGNEQWDEVARDFMDRMGFTETAGKAPCRWVAMHHGLSGSGNDHVHIVASMVREDGTKWDGRWRDFKTAQEAARAVEVKYGLARVEGRLHGTAERGEKPAERYAAARAGRENTAPKDLAHVVRSAATASTSEAEWVRRVRASDVVIKPYFASGSTDVVRGYRVALKPTAREERLVFYGGGRLGKDLTLPRLREGWPEPSVEAASQAAAEWQAAFRGQPPSVTTGRETRPAAPTAPEVAARQWAAFNERLAQVPVQDHAAWAEAARDVSGALSAWARYDGTHAADLRHAAAVVARSAQQQRRAVDTRRRAKESPMGTAYLFLAARRDDKPKITAAVLIRQIVATAAALRDYHAATANMREAQAMHREVIERLGRVSLVGYATSIPETMSAQERTAWEARKVALQGHGTGVPVRNQGPAPSPLPNALQPRQAQVPARSGQGKEGERDER